MKHVKLVVYQLYCSIFLRITAIVSKIKKAFKNTKKEPNKDPWERYIDRKKSEENYEQRRNEIASIGKVTRTLMLLIYLLPESDEVITIENFQETKNEVISYMNDLKETEYQFDKETVDYIQNLTYEEYTKNSEECYVQIRYLANKNAEKVFKREVVI